MAGFGPQAFLTDSSALYKSETNKLKKLCKVQSISMVKRAYVHMCSKMVKHLYFQKATLEG